jgi:hypothetical protein
MTTTFVYLPFLRLHLVIALLQLVFTFLQAYTMHSIREVIMTLQDTLEQRPKEKRLMTRSDFVGMYRTAHMTLSKYINSGDIAVHLIGTTIYIDADEAFKVLRKPPLRHASLIKDLFSQD